MFEPPHIMLALRTKHMRNKNKCRPFLISLTYSLPHCRLKTTIQYFLQTFQLHGQQIHLWCNKGNTVAISQ